MSKIACLLKRITFTTLLICSVSQTAFAVPVLSFNNAQADVSQVAQIGDTIILELWFSGLESDDVGGFDFLLSFNNTVSQLTSAQANLALTDFDEFNISAGPAALDFSGVSYLFDLSAQADEFMLATLSFVANSEGVSDIALSNILISDSFATAIDFSVFDAQLIVNRDPNTLVPEPTTIGVFMLGLLSLVARQKGKKLPESEQL